MGDSGIMKFVFFQTTVELDFLFCAGVTFLMCVNTGDEIRYGIIFSLIHEIGHLIAVFLCGETPELIRFGAFGMTIVRKNDITQDYKKEFITALSGPMMNFLCSGIFCLFYLVFGNSLFLSLSIINIIIGGFNIMPIFLLDGGRALESLLKSKYSEEKSERVMKRVSLMFLIPMIFFGLLILIKSKYNFTFLAIGIYLTVMLFIKC